MLAALPEPEVAAMFDDAAPLPALTKRSVTRLADLLADLRQISKRGCALNREDGSASVAVAVAGRQESPGGGTRGLRAGGPV